MTESHPTSEPTRKPLLRWKPAILAGLIAGAVFIVLEMVLVATIGGGTPWGPTRMIGAIVLGQDVLPPPGSFHAPAFIAAMAVHFSLSIVLAIVFALIAERFGSAGAPAYLAGGAVFGLLIYGIHFYGFTSVFPWFEAARNPISIFAHIVFGLVLAWSYRSLAR